MSKLDKLTDKKLEELLEETRKCASSKDVDQLKNEIKGLSIELVTYFDTIIDQASVLHKLAKETDNIDLINIADKTGSTGVKGLTYSMIITALTVNDEQKATETMVMVEKLLTLVDDSKNNQQEFNFNKNN
jgi:hypothetical protein